jgi:hypothetical protein
VQQLKVERDQAQRRLEQLDQALEAIDGLSGSPRSGEWPQICQDSESNVGDGSSANRRGATCPLGQMEGW